MFVEDYCTEALFHEGTREERLICLKELKCFGKATSQLISQELFTTMIFVHEELLKTVGLTKRKTGSLTLGSSLLPWYSLVSREGRKDYLMKFASVTEEILSNTSTMQQIATFWVSIGKNDLFWFLENDEQLNPWQTGFNSDIMPAKQRGRTSICPIVRSMSSFLETAIQLASIGL